MPTIIRPVKSTELKQVQAFASETFSLSYAHLNDPKDFEEYMETAFNTKQISTEFNNPNSFFYFLEKDKQVIGYIKLNASTAQTDLHETDSLELERIYVHPSAQGKGHGKDLLKEAIRIAKAKRKSSLWLGVWRRNTKALAFYQSQGFIKFGEHTFVIGAEKQVDYLMRIGF